MKLINTKDNNFTVNINNINIHSKYSPTKEAEKFVAQNITPSGTVLVLGAGLGYIFKAINKLSPKIKIISIPYSFELNNKALELNPTDRIEWNKNYTIEEFLNTNIKENNIKGLQIIEWQPTAKAFKDTATYINKALVKRVRILNGNLMTTARFGKRWLNNSIRNYIHIENYIDNISINKPIVIVAPGKSLKYSIETLKKIRSSVFLISLSSANMALNYYNIKPDITFSSDPGYYSKLHLKGYNGLISMPLTNSTSENNSVLLINQGNEFEKTFIDMGNIPSVKLNECGTVAGTALQFALKYSSEKIYLFGQDLQSTDIESHIKPYAFDNLLNKITCKTQPYYTIKYTRWINQGTTYNTYRDWFSKVGKENENRVFRFKSSSTPLEHIKEITGDQLEEQITNNKNNPITYTTFKNSTKEVRQSQVITILNKWLNMAQKDEIREKSLFYLISTSHYTDMNNKALSDSEVNEHINLCKKESILFIKRLLSLYGRQIL